MTTLSVALLLLNAWGATPPGPESVVAFETGDGRLSILAGGEPVAVYVYEDPEIPRPYFCDVRAPGGAQVTRNHPPDPVVDARNDDHPSFHPGLWLAFGELGGADFWRNRARVRHLRFEQAPEDGTEGSFAVVNAYETTGTPPRRIAEETCRYTIVALGDERWIIADSEFRAAAPGVAFGDQEELGFGVRLATALTVRHGNGTIINDRGGIDEAGTWGKQADWCAYSGVLNGRRTGILLATSPRNFRASWFHNRDYGLMVANPFGRKAMTGPRDDTVPPDATPLPQDKTLRLGFAVCVFAAKTDQHPDYAAMYARYLDRLTDEFAPAAD